MKRVLLYFYIPVVTLYVALAIVFPTDPGTIARRHLTLGQARFMALSVAVPLIIIWLLALYSTWRLKEYSNRIKGYHDGTAFEKLASGMQLLAVYLPLRSVVKVSLNYFAHLYPLLTD